MPSGLSIFGIATDPLADASGSAQSRRVQTPGESLEWRTPGSHMYSRLAGASELLHLLEQVRSNGHLVLVLLRRETEEILDRVFNAQRELYSMFPSLAIDVRVIQKSEDWDFASLQANSISWF